MKKVKADARLEGRKDCADDLGIYILKIKFDYPIHIKINTLEAIKAALNFNSFEFISMIL